MRMNRRWLIAATLGAAAGVSQAADVQVYGIHTPASGKWAVYARVSNPQSITPEAGKENIAGLSSITFDLLNNSNVNGSATINTAAVLQSPKGTTNKTDTLVGNVGYGFWLFQSTGTSDPTGMLDIRAGQYVAFPSSHATISQSQWNSYVLQGVGLNSGNKLVGGDFTSASAWNQPVLLATGTYTPSATSGAGAEVGLTIRLASDTTINVLKDMDATAAVTWNGPGNIEAANGLVVDAQTLLAGSTTHRGLEGDANLDGAVNFFDLTTLAANYGAVGTWFEGDFNFDGQINFFDLTALSANYGTAAAGEPVPSASFSEDLALAFANVPEPGGAGFVLGMALVKLCRRRRN